MRSSGALLLAAACAAAILASPAVAGVVEVQVHLPVPQKIDVTGMRRVLVGGFRANDDPDLDIGPEYSDFLRASLWKRSPFDILDVPPPPLPEQELRDIIRNTSYWKRLAQRYTADLILAGLVEFTRSDKSGFISEDIISPVTGQRIRRTRYAEREGFDLAVTLLYFAGATGELLYENRLTESAIYDGRGNDPLSALHQLAERATPEILGVLVPRTKTETRFLFTE